MFESVVGILIIVGAIFTLIGSIGLYKLPDFYMRLHGPTKATTLGVGSILIASAVYFSFKTDSVTTHEILITVFLFITAPVSAHLMAKSALHIKIKQKDSTN